MLHPRRCLLLVLLALAGGCGGRSAPGQPDGAVPGDARSPDGALSDGALPDGALPDGALPDGGLPACTTLALPACRQRADCAVDLCFACSCTPSFEGCRAATAPAFDCPQYGCPLPLCCEASQECQAMGGDCAPPGSPYPCGMCNPDPGDCAADGDCAVGNICAPLPCSCDGASLCVPGCTPPDACPVGTTCSGGDHPRCVATACSANAPCPPDFDCDGGTCARRACTSDLQCDRFCVGGRCFEGYGECRQPAP